MAKVLIACECSGVVRDAFLSLGHKAMSCDLKPTERLGPHYVGNVWDLIECPRDKGTWDLIIAHPPCDHIAVSGAAHFAAKRADGRQQMGAEVMGGNKPPPEGASAQDYGIYCLLRAVEDLALAMEK